MGHHSGHGIGIRSKTFGRQRGSGRSGGGGRSTAVAIIFIYEAISSHHGRAKAQQDTVAGVTASIDDKWRRAGQSAVSAPRVTGTPR